MSEPQTETLFIASSPQRQLRAGSLRGVLPKERFSSFSHAVSAVLAAAGLALLLIAARGDLLLSLVAAVYGVGAVLMFAASALYHAHKREDDEMSVWRRLDHSAIFIMIAGTFTPICYLHLSTAWFYSIVGTQWGLVVAGISFKLVWLHAPRWLTTGIYLAMGWMAVVAIVPFVESMTTTELLLLAAGGASYSIGALVYGLKKPNPWANIVGFHGLFHLFVIGGAFAHFLLIYSGITAASTTAG